jgi:hypothetical protein
MASVPSGAKTTHVNVPLNVPIALNRGGGLNHRAAKILEGEVREVEPVLVEICQSFGQVEDDFNHGQS